jgi:hypothetical protein
MMRTKGREWPTDGIATFDFAAVVTATAGVAGVAVCERTTARGSDLGKVVTSAVTPTASASAATAHQIHWRPSRPRMPLRDSLVTDY